MTAPPLPLEDAQARLFALAAPLPLERCDVAGAVGRYLAQPLTARRTHPPADLSAMDGYAVAAGDLSGPWRVIGESAAGHPFAGRISRGEAARISTGALMPEGCGAVIVQEDIARSGERVALTGEGPKPEAKHVRRAGLDFAEGQPLLAEGTRLGPAQAALAIAGGHKHVPVRRRPLVAVLDSGDELCPEDERCEPHQVPASNGLMLAAMARSLPCDVRRIGPVPDDLDALATALDRARDADVIVTSGGASVGDHDLIRPALEACGATLDFWRVAIKPGKPLLVATRPTARSRQVILGLPGNPGSTFVTAFLFLLPLLRALLGSAEPLPRRISARLGAPLGRTGPRREFLRARWDGSTIAPLHLQDSGVLGSLAMSNALIDRPADAEAAISGQDVTGFLLQNGGIA